MVYTPKYEYSKGDPMIAYFKQDIYIYTDKQYIDIEQASMIVQEKEPLSPQRSVESSTKKNEKHLALPPQEGKVGCFLFIG